MKNEWTRKECEAIRDGWNALKWFCDSTNHSDHFALATAIKEERKALRDAADMFFARARILESWLEGYLSPDAPLSARAYWMRDGVLRAMLLGVRHAVECKHRIDELAQVQQRVRAAIAAKEAGEYRRKGKESV